VVEVEVGNVSGVWESALSPERHPSELDHSELSNMLSHLPVGHLSPDELAYNQHHQQQESAMETNMKDKPQVGKIQRTQPQRAVASDQIVKSKPKAEVTELPKDPWTYKKPTTVAVAAVARESNPVYKSPEKQTSVGTVKPSYITSRTSPEKPENESDSDVAAAGLIKSKRGKLNVCVCFKENALVIPVCFIHVDLF
jgi:hypothetical protein